MKKNLSETSTKKDLPKTVFCVERCLEEREITLTDLSLHNQHTGLRLTRTRTSLLLIRMTSSRAQSLDKDDDEGTQEAEKKVGSRINRIKIRFNDNQWSDEEQLKWADT
ncbi:hypothetical protein KIN20_036837 [Parelaphostrongylus tenuis]|uniref:Uncharacterized protein n=1 Tax=Parelaphostrongylus tenuis TaxID=148309 RepID=A0AAD5RGZ3_PARTN|nr:hypothetical protein KIN20_036837 [Parelaphostrongylus tenuis]